MHPTDVASCPPEELRRLLRTVRRHSPAGRALAAYFGEEHLDRLERRARAAGPPAGVVRPAVVFVPGLMASRLSVRRKGRGSGVVWIDILRLMNGGLADLALAADGVHESDRGREVIPAGVDRRASADLLVALGPRFDVREFAYDWRRSMSAAADGLAEYLLRSPSLRRPVHLLAHSFGGLVCRLMLRRHPRLRTLLGGRLIMAGVPHGGSYAAVQALAGEDEVIRLLAALDVRHTRADVQDIVAGYPSCYELLPETADAAGGPPGLFDSGWWNGIPIRTAHLQRARRLRSALRRRDLPDPDRMTCIIGTGCETLAGVERIAEGRLRFLSSTSGDGTVTTSQASLEGVEVLSVTERHGRLLANDDVLTAVGDLLAEKPGRRTPAIPPAVRSAGERVWFRGVEAACRESSFAEAARQLRAHPAAEALVSRTGRILRDVSAGGAEPEADRPQAFPLEVVVRTADVTRVRVPLLVLGHYAGVPPVRAIGAVDEALGNWLSGEIARAALSGAFGHLTYLPVRRAGMGAETILIAGMGDEGALTEDDLRCLVASVTASSAGLGFRELAAVLFGSGQLGVENALRSFLAGVEEGRASAAAGTNLRRLTIVEHDRRRARAIASLVPLAGGRERYRVTLARAGGGTRKRVRRGSAGEPFGARIAVERSGSLFRFSLMTGTAVIPLEESEVQPDILRRLSELTTLARTPARVRQASRTLGRLLLPGSFAPALRGRGAVTFIVDRASCNVPWEMLAPPGDGGVPLCLRVPVVRQLRSGLPRAPHAASGRRTAFRVLVLADPAPGAHLRLPGAAEEGRRITEFLRSAGEAGGCPILVTARIGPEECDVAEILHLLLEGTFDVVHFAGHSVFDEARSPSAGWVLGETKGGGPLVVSAREMFRARRPPRMVFANACLSARLPLRPFRGDAAQAVRLAGLAEAFLATGVAHYIGTGWSVRDEAARVCALAFYRALLRGSATVAGALLAGRRAVASSGGAWGAYHHYGNVVDRWRLDG